MDPRELAMRERLAQEQADRLKRALPRIHVEPLSGERNVTRFGKRKHKFREDDHVGVKPDPIQSTNAER
jgi:hypothetical protein